MSLGSSQTCVYTVKAVHDRRLWLPVGFEVYSSIQLGARPALQGPRRLPLVGRHDVARQSSPLDGPHVSTPSNTTLACSSQG